MLRNALADPHQERAAGGHGRHSHDDALRSEVIKKPLAAEAHRHGDGLDQCQHHSQITGVAHHLPAAILALPLEFLQLRDGDGHQLHDNGGCDVGGNAKCQNAHLLKGAASDRVEEAECVARRLTLLLEEVLQVLRIHAGNGQVAAEADHNQHQERVQQTITNFLDLQCVSETCQHFRSPRRFPLPLRSLPWRFH